jgi:hypothetical protein
MSDNAQQLVLNDAMSPVSGVIDSDLDLNLLKLNLAKSPWERMQANDDALNFAESLRAAMEKRNAKPE